MGYLSRFADCLASQTAPLCPKGHLLAAKSQPENACLSCGRRGTRNHCARCDYKICKPCFDGSTWRRGGRRRVALFSGGGFHKLHDGSDEIQACDEECVTETGAALRIAGFTVITLDIEQVGSNSAQGEEARAALRSCCVAVLPGGHDIPQADALGDMGKTALHSVLERGGGLVGICAGACLLSKGLPSQENCYGWLPISCDPTYGDFGLKGKAALTASEEGAGIFGPALQGDVHFDESPSMIIPGDIPGIVVDATYAVQEKMGKEAKGLSGGAAVVRGQASSGPRSAGRMVLIATHFELTGSVGKGLVIARAVDWAAGDSGVDSPSSKVAKVRN